MTDNESDAIELVALDNSESEKAIKNVNNLSLYPNPSTESFTIQTSMEGIKLVQVFNLNGQEIIKKEFENENIKFGETLSTGLYIAKISNDTHTSTIKISKE